MSFDVSTTTRTCGNKDNHNVLSVMAVDTECDPTDETLAGCVVTYLNQYNPNAVVENDICLAGANHDWEIVQSQISGGEVDLQTVLLHEFGHWLGLNHFYSSVMAGGEWPDTIGSPSTGDNLRHLLGDDILGVRAIYGTTGRQRRWRQWNGSSFSTSSHAFGGTSNWQRTSGHIGRDSNNTQWVVSAALNRDGTRQYFARAQYPLSAASVWTQTYFNTNSWVTAAVVSNPYGGASAKWVAAWPNKQLLSSDQCSISVFVSSNAFASGTHYSLAGCSLLQVALGYDYSTGRFLMVYVNFDPDHRDSGRMFVRTSVNGSSWTQAQDLNRHSLDSPGLDCGYNGCVLTYARASSDVPTAVAREISVDSSGQVTLHTYTEGLLDIMSTPDVGVYFDSGTPHFMLVASEPDSPDDAINGIGDVYYHFDSTNPPGNDVWVLHGDEVPAPPAFAGGLWNSYGYLLTAD